MFEWFARLRRLTTALEIPRFEPIEQRVPN
jgi:hypothetical protein